MRVIAGSARRTQLKTLEGMDTRPTTDRIKETLFNMIAPYLYDSIFLDLFAGSGGIGLEAVSRGAKKAVFVENSKKAAACIQENIRFTKFTSSCDLKCMDALSALRMLERRYVFDIIFMDPPYGLGLEYDVLLHLKDSSILTEDTLIIVEESLDTDPYEMEKYGFEITRIKRYKTNQHVIILQFIQVKRIIRLLLYMVPNLNKKKDKMKKAIYPGSFDPMTLGHLDIIERSSKMVDELNVAVLKNNAKNPLFSADERVSMIKEMTDSMPNVTVTSFNGLLVDYMREIDATIIVRGLRAVTDFEYELQIAQTNHVENPEVETIFLTTSLQYSYLSSTIVKEFASYGGDLSKFVPARFIDRIYDKYQIKK